MADSRLFGGRRLAGIDWAFGALAQSLLEVMIAPAPLCNSNEGFASASAIPKPLNVGPRARKRIDLFPLPVMIKPAIRTLLPVRTKARVEIFDSLDEAPATVTVPFINIGCTVQK